MVRRIVIALGLSALFTPLASLALLHYVPALDANLQHTYTHFWVVGATSLAAVIACAIVVASARSLRETRLLFLALAFISIAGIFSVHGLMTPGVLDDEVYASVGVSAWLSVAAGALFVALSAAELPEFAERFLRKAGGMFAAWVVVGVATYIVLSLNLEDWLNGVPTDNRNVQYAIAVGTTLLFAFAIYRYAQAYLFARLPSHAAMVVSLTLLGQVPAILLWGNLWHVSWWSYHAVYALAFVALFAGWALEVRRAGSLRAIADALSMRDAVAQLNRGRERPIIELVEQLEAKDRYTVGHVHRVGTFAYEIGRQLGLSQPELRHVVLAAEMHDIGKLNTPESILLKPARLTEDERHEMEKHSVRSGEIAKRVAVLSPVADAIRAHHERFAGGGYPDGMASEQIPLIARIVSVADTYDAMTSSRPYREALSHESAVAELRRVSGTQLDPGCVEAFLASFDQRAAAAA
jgi:HD-GYP domain-containing protein (c-di-GMP phosphodiesterase class II)